MKLERRLRERAIIFGWEKGMGVTTTSMSYVFLFLSPERGLCFACHFLLVTKR